VRRLYEEVARW